MEIWSGLTDVLLTHRQQKKGLLSLSKVYAESHNLRGPVKNHFVDFICVYKITKKRGVLKKWLSGLCFKDADCVLFSGRCAILSSCHSSPFYVAGKTSRKQFFLFPKSQDLAKLSKTQQNKHNNFFGHSYLKSGV